jgi:hypothetical protein
VVDGIGVYLPLWTAETSIISFAAHVPFYGLFLLSADRRQPLRWHGVLRRRIRRGATGQLQRVDSCLPSGSDRPGSWRTIRTSKIRPRDAGTASPDAFAVSCLHPRFVGRRMS